MRYSFAIIAAFLGAAAASPAIVQSTPLIPVSEYTDGQPQQPTALPTTTTVLTLVSTQSVTVTAAVSSTTTVTVAAPSSPESTENGALPASSTAAGPSISVISITTCIPTVILSTVTLSPPSTTAIVPPPYSVQPTGTIASASTVVGALPTGSPITPFQGNSASSFGASFAMAGVAVVAAIVLA
ncbi:MAG: hypothetical protein MMC33_001500 [Icmadophila ericetorum]|nr:hypothetical protein [Icmadophila ericetorum]